MDEDDLSIPEFPQEAPAPADGAWSEAPTPEALVAATEEAERAGRRAHRAQVLQLGQAHLEQEARLAEARARRDARRAAFAEFNPQIPPPGSDDH